jgi:hypothetical protein
VKVVVSDAPLNRTTEVGTKPEPVTVSAIGEASPAVALAGAIVVTTTLVGFATVNASGFETDPGFVMIVTWKIPHGRGEHLSGEVELRAGAEAFARDGDVESLGNGADRDGIGRDRGQRGRGGRRARRRCGRRSGRRRVRRVGRGARGAGCVARLLRRRGRTLENPDRNSRSSDEPCRQPRAGGPRPNDSR